MEDQQGKDEMCLEKVALKVLEKRAKEVDRRQDPLLKVRITEQTTDIESPVKSHALDQTTDAEARGD